MSKRLKGRSLMEFPADYIAIDIETTGLDSKYDEIIEVAAVRFSGGVEVDRYQSLVKPEYDIDPFITELTGITNDMVADAPTIENVLPKYRDFLGGAVLVGHNVNFDINFLYDMCERLGLPPLGNDFVDTYRLSRRLYKDLPNYKLPTLAEHLEIKDIPAHRALADCLCASGCLKAMQAYADSIGGIPEPGWMHFGQLADYIIPETSDFDLESPIYGKVFAFTGKLELFTRAEAMQKVANAGGINGNGVTKDTNYLVLGSTDYCAALRGAKSAKHKKAESLILKGQDLQIISEGTFLEMLSTDEALRASAPPPAETPDRDEVEFLNSIRPGMVAVIEASGGDGNMLSITSAKAVPRVKGDIVSVKVGSMVAFRVRLRGNSKYIAVPSIFAALIPENYPRVPAIGEQKFIKIIVDARHPVEGYCDFLFRILSETLNRYPSEWSCCSRYMECSDAKKCTNPNKSAALVCAYRKVLSSGRIFYGNNRNI